MALCAAIFDKKDILLFIKIKEKGINSETSTEISRFLYNSFDIILDKINYPGAKATQDLYIGSLLINSSFRSFGYLTNTNTKFLLVTDVENNLLKDHEIRLFFKKLHSKYFCAIANPFYVFGNLIKSKHIDNVVQEFIDCF
uniref:Trafficking protein particle complex subunit 2-like protein n=1 Tax=Meloidogyne incognita TaxID=6306 RepID=A0A914LBF9_MELIC